MISTLLNSIGNVLRPYSDDQERLESFVSILKNVSSAMDQDTEQQLKSEEEIISGDLRSRGHLDAAVAESVIYG